MFVFIYIKSKDYSLRPQKYSMEYNIRKVCFKVLLHTLWSPSIPTNVSQTGSKMRAYQHGSKMRAYQHQSVSRERDTVLLYPYLAAPKENTQYYQMPALSFGLLIK